MFEFVRRMLPRNRVDRVAVPEGDWSFCLLLALYEGDCVRHGSTLFDVGLRLRLLVLLGHGATVV